MFRGSKAIPTLFKGLVFVTPLLLCFIWMEHGLRKIVNPYSYARAQAEAHHTECQILVLGSSNAAWGIDTKSMSVPALNLANVAQSLYYDLAIAERYVPLMPHLKAVILPVTYVTFESEAYDWAGSNRPFYLSQFWGIPLQGDTFFRSERWSLTSLYGVRMSIAFARHGFNANTLPTFVAATLPAGFAPETGEEHVGVIHPERLPFNLERLERLVALVEHQGANLVLIETPSQDAYLRRLSPVVVSRNLRHRDEFLTRHPGVLHFDHTHDPRFGPEAFWDPAHLNPRGAARFAKILETEATHEKRGKP